ncbi:MAG TPA: copper homeostasis protein CutC [Rhizomicrobium sp.]|nr:copper homeostasis protein CutC [Rhizomicrobium sp.]
MPHILLEVCVDSPAGFNAAIEGGADRIELCSSLGVGGLTPSAGFVAFAAKGTRPSRAMIRPRIGSYVFSEDEIDVMRRDIDAVRAAGLAGVVIGGNLASGQLDEKTTARLAQHAAGLELTLHRSVDLMPKPLEAVDVAIALGFRTILTSGGALKAPDGADTVAAMVARAGDSLEILGGSGLNPGNVVSFIRKTGVKAVHGSFSAPWPEIDQNLVRFGFIGNDARETSRDTVRRVREAIDSLA